jgi:demethylmenaquinone methyltransferase / 2-methoxy-6-polyprenyl-1,4-benzoquinol methylase
VSVRKRHAQRLFAGIAPEYERMGPLLSFAQDARWRRFMVSRVDVGLGAWVLDVAAGTGLVARELAVAGPIHVAALDQSEAMLRAGAEANRRAGDGRRIVAVLGQAERLPFADGSFDAVTFTYLLRYVDDPQATLAELGRVLRARGTLACTEFHVPRGPLARAGWRAYTRLLMPAVGWLASPAWHDAARFLGPSIAAFYERYPLPEQIRMWQSAGLHHVRTRVLSLGAGIVISGTKGDPER